MPLWSSQLLIVGFLEVAVKIKSLKLHFWFLKWQLHAYGVGVLCKSTQEQALKRCQRWFYGCWCVIKSELDQFGMAINVSTASPQIRFGDSWVMYFSKLSMFSPARASHLLVSIILIFKRRCFILILIVMTWELYRVCSLCRTELLCGQCDQYDTCQ